jgi:hypothetical protein
MKRSQSTHSAKLLNVVVGKGEGWRVRMNVKSGSIEGFELFYQETKIYKSGQKQDYLFLWDYEREDFSVS